MWDGESCTAIAKTFLKDGDKLASTSCHVCLATKKDLSKQEAWDRPVIKEMLNYSCTVLHMWIRAMEYLLNLACKLPHQNDLPLTSEACQAKKLEIQARFWVHLNLRVCEVKHGKGSSNNGNTARKFFKKDSHVTATILGLDERIVCLFGELLDMFNDPNDKPCSTVFQRKARELFNLLTSPPCHRFPLSQSVHR